MKVKSAIAVLALCVLTQVSVTDAAYDGDYYYALGQTQEAGREYPKAFRSYSRAAAFYANGTDNQKFIDAENGWYRTNSILTDFSYTLPEFKAKVKKYYPWATADDINGWLATKTFLTMDMDVLGGVKTFYYFSEVDNLKYRDQAIMDANNEYHGNPLKKFIDLMLENYAKADYSSYSAPFDRPKDILADLQFSVKKSKLPKNGDGIVRIWWPMPLNTACQGSIVEISIEPSEYLVSKTSPDSDIGVAYFEIPVDKIQGELVIRTQVRFRHFQQRFQIAPETIQAYDKESELYKKYTAPSLNIAITPEITARAKQIVGAETNPFRAAKLLNDYITANVPYSFPEYNTNDALGIPLSTYTEGRQFGDCGYQSAYFTALCRSIGIPARPSGGFQYFIGKPQSHFWSEFYLPEPYSAWIPNDVTVAEMNKEALGYSQEDLQAYGDFFFGQQDPFRMVVQNDIDIPLTPEPENGSYFFKACLQDPVMLFYGSNKAMMMSSKDRHFYCSGAYEFNYDNAINSLSGGEIQVEAKDFGLTAFGENAKFFLKDTYLGKSVEIKLSVKQFSDGNSGAVLMLPASLDHIAYRLSCLNSLKEKEAFSGRWVIIGKP